ncbi:DNA gyrase subunit B [bacterium AB1]|nr:DNA gyrase subunit B [bacterium AB1]
MSENKYSSSNIKVLDNIAAIRKYPGMYIGSVVNPNHLIMEVINNSVDEVLMKHANYVSIFFKKDNSVTIKDNGRGIPIDEHQSGSLACEIVFLATHSGGKFDDNVYQKSGGLHGIGLVAVNALSTSLDVSICRDGFLCQMHFKKGVLESTTKVETDITDSFTEISFIADDSIFDEGFLKSEIKNQCQQLASLNKDLQIHYKDEETGEDEIIKSKNGLEDLVNMKIKESLFSKNVKLIHNSEKIDYEVFFNWDSVQNDESIFAFTNCIIQPEYGAHVNGVRSGILKFLYDIKEISEVMGNSTLVWNDVKKGFRMTVHVRIQHPKFDSQSKVRLISNEIKKILEKNIFEELKELNKNNPKLLENLISMVYKILISKTSKDNNDGATISALMCDGRLSDCTTEDRENAELFITEGESARGTIKPVLDKQYQAVLSLRGKILNIEKANIRNLLDSKVINLIIYAIGGSRDKMGNVVIDKPRFGKVILVVDADVDGSHIRALLLTMFYRLIPQIIVQKKLYVALPPLFRAQTKNESIYLKNKSALSSYLYNIISNKYLNYEFNEQETAVINSVIEFIHDNVDIQNKFYLILIDACICLDVFEYNQILENSALINKKIKEQHPNWDLFVSTDQKIYIEDFMNLEKCTIDENFYTHFLLPPIKSVLNISNKEMINKINSILQEKYFDNLYSTFHSLKRRLDKEILVQRFKGLGEMNSDQIYETVVNKESRQLKCININDMDQTENMCIVLMGSDISMRKDYITSIYDQYL